MPLYSFANLILWWTFEEYHISPYQIFSYYFWHFDMKYNHKPGIWCQISKWTLWLVQKSGPHDTQVFKTSYRHWSTKLDIFIAVLHTTINRLMLNVRAVLIVGKLLLNSCDACRQINCGVYVSLIDERYVAKDLKVKAPLFIVSQPPSFNLFKDNSGLFHLEMENVFNIIHRTQDSQYLYSLRVHVAS